MDITLFLLYFAKTLALFAVIWLLVTLVAYTFNRATDDEHGPALAGATEFALWLPVWLFALSMFDIIELPRSALAAPEPPFEVKAGAAVGLTVYLCLSYLAKKRYESKKS